MQITKDYTMKLGIIIYSNEPETVWNAFRLGILSCKKEDTVKIFLLAKGVECECLDKEYFDEENFNITETMNEFIKFGGEILACGTCLEIRRSKSTSLCPISTMDDLYNIIIESDKVLTF